MPGRDVLARLIDRRIVEVVTDRQPVRTVRVLGRNSDGTLQLQREDGECVSRGCEEGAYQGETLKTARVFCAQDIGTSELVVNRFDGGGSFLWVESLSPSQLFPGTSVQIVVTGYGFNETTVFEFLLPDSETINEDITIDAITFVDDTTVWIDVTVDADAAGLIGCALAFDNPNQV